MGQFLGATLLEEMRGYRRLLDMHVRIPLLQAVGRESDSAEDHEALHVKLATVCFKVELLDALVDLFRLHDPEAVAADERAALSRRRRVAAPTARQVDAMRRVRRKTIELDRQIAFAQVAHLLMATDGLRHRDRELFPIEFERLDERFGPHYGQWTIAVAPMIVAFCRSPGLDEDIRLRAALDDFVFQLRKTAAPTAVGRTAITPDVALLEVVGHAD